MANTVEYFINLRDEFSQAAERVAAAAKDAMNSIASMGKATATAETNLQAAATAMKNIDQQTVALNRTMAQKYGTAVNAPGAAQAVAARNAATAAADATSKGPNIYGGASAYMIASAVHNDVLKDALDFDEQMRLIRGKAADLTDTQFGQLREQMIKIARGTLFSATEMAKAASTAAGMDIRDPDAIATLVKQSAAVATATHEGIDEVLKAHLNLTRQFGLDPKTAFPHISDVLMHMQQTSGMTIPQISNQMANWGTVAQQSGWSFEEAAEAVNFLAKKGLQNQAGAGLSRFLTLLNSHSKVAAKALGDAGMSRDDFIDAKTGAMKSLPEVVQILNEHTKLMGAAEKLKLYSKLFGYRGQRVGAAFSQADPAQLKKNIEELTALKDYAEQQAQKAMQGPAAASTMFQKAMENLHIGMGEAGLGSVFDAIARAAAKAVDAIGGMPPLLKGAAGMAAAIANAFSSSALQIGVLIALFPRLGEAIGLAATRAATLAGALAPVAGVIGALAYLYSVSNTPEKRKAELERENKMTSYDHAAVNAILERLGFRSGSAADQAARAAAGSQGNTNVKVETPDAIRIYVEGLTDAGRKIMGEGSLPLNSVTSQGEHGPALGVPVPPGGH